MRALADVAEDADVVLVHENEKEIYGDVPSRCLDIVGRSGRRTCGWPGTRPTSSRSGSARTPRGTPSLRPHLEYMQIKDALAADGTVVTAGDGDGEVVRDHPGAARRRVRRVLLARAALGDGHGSAAFSGPELFRRAHAAFTGLLQTEGIEYA